jgi:hypothetical protein
VNEISNHNTPYNDTVVNKNDDVPAPIFDDNLTNDEREKIRAERAAAAEARLQKLGGGTSKRPKKPSNDEPLRGPNSKPLMTWTTG